MAGLRTFTTHEYDDRRLDGCGGRNRAHDDGVRRHVLLSGPGEHRLRSGVIGLATQFPYTIEDQLFAFIDLPQRELFSSVFENASYTLMSRHVLVEPTRHWMCQNGPGAIPLFGLTPIFCRRLRSTYAPDEGCNGRRPSGNNVPQDALQIKQAAATDAFANGWNGETSRSKNLMRGTDHVHSNLVKRERRFATQGCRVSSICLLAARQLTGQAPRRSQ